MRIILYHLCYLLCLLLCCTSTSWGQVNIDSLKLVAENAENDSIKGGILNMIAWEYKTKDLVQSEKYCLQAIELTTKSGQKKQRSTAYNTLGLVKMEQLSYSEALKYLELSVKDKIEINDRKGLATVKNNMGVIYKQKGELDLAIKLYGEALQEQEAIGNIRGQAEALGNIGVAARMKGALDQSTEYFKKCIVLYKQLNDKKGLALIYNNLSANASDQSDYSLCLDYLYEAVRIYEETGQKLALVTVYANIGNVHHKLKKEQSALEYCYKSIELAKEIGAEKSAIPAFSTLGDAFFELSSIDKAELTYQEGLSIAEANTNFYYHSHFYLGLGICHLEKKNFEKALTYLEKAIELARKHEQTLALARALQKLGKFYIDTKEPNKAKQLLDEAIQIAKKNQYKEILFLCYISYAKLHKALNEDSQTVEFLTQANLLNDSIFSTDVALKFAEMQTKYETAKKEAALQIMQQENEIKALKIQEQQSALSRNRFLLLAAVVGLLLVVLIAFLALSNQRLKNKFEQEALAQKVKEAERMRIAKDIHDELGSGLSKIMFLSSVFQQQSEQLPPKQQASLTAISTTARALIENMRDLIWAMNPENTTLEYLIARIREYSSDYLEDFPIELQLHFPNAIPSIKLSNEFSRNTFMIVKEALQNIVKHANANRVEIEVDVNDKMLSIFLKDDGQGFDSTAIVSGNGLSNLAQRSKFIGAQFSLNSNPGKGTEIRFSVALPNQVH